MNAVTEIQTSRKEKATENWATHIATFFFLGTESKWPRTSTPLRFLHDKFMKNKEIKR